MSKVALAVAIALLLFFTYLTAVRPAYAWMVCSGETACSTW